MRRISKGEVLSGGIGEGFDDQAAIGFIGAVEEGAG
jgi:hypothetical protein